MKRAIAVILVFAIAGCVGKFHRVRVAERAQTSLIGMSKKDLYLCAGVPVRQEHLGLRALPALRQTQEPTRPASRSFL